MVNNNMNQNQSTVEQKPVKKPNEAGVFSVEAHVKIYDPNTKEVLVEKRA
jgi:hypothetical protein